MKVLITGASLFVVASLCKHLSTTGLCEVVALYRSAPPSDARSWESLVVPDLSKMDRMIDVMRPIDVVIHLAGLAHRSSNQQDHDEYFRINTDLTLSLAECAVAAQVTRFIYLSSTKVYGDDRGTGTWSEGSVTRPTDAYGASKLKAEQLLMKLSQSSSLEVVIMLPPLIYGAGVKGNMGVLLRIVNSHLPLPFGSLSKNKRSMISVQNLSEFLGVCLHHRNAVGEIFLVSDGEDLTMRELSMLLIRFAGSRSPLLYVPTVIFQVFAGFNVLEGKIARLTEGFTVETSKAKRLLSWEAPVDVSRAIQEMLHDDVSLTKSRETKGSTRS